MKKAGFVMIRVKPALKQAMKRISQKRSSPGGHKVTITDIVMNALYANDPEVFVEMRKIEAQQAAESEETAPDKKPEAVKA